MDFDKELKHIEVGIKLDKMEELRPKVILGFVIFWACWIIAALITLGYYIVSWIH